MIHSSIEGAVTNNRLVDVAECRSLSAFCVCARKVARDALFSILSPSREGFNEPFTVALTVTVEPRRNFRTDVRFF